MPDQTTDELDLLLTATQRLIRSVDGLTDDELREPSGLPDWTRGHVVAHLALNAEGLAGAMSGIVAGEPTTIYESQEARDNDIAELAAAEPSELRNRLLGATTEFTDAVAAMPDDAWTETIERTPGGPTVRAEAVVGMRLREVEIHHADLAAGYAHTDWPVEFSSFLLHSMTKRDSWSEPFQARATDVREAWAFGEPGDDDPVVAGPVADLGWWATGRGNGEGLSCTTGALPRIGAW